MPAHQDYPGLSIGHLCSLLEVNRAWYYASQQEQIRDDPEVALRDAIELMVLEFPGYGYRRVTHALKRVGWTINHKHVLRVMREESLLCQLKRQFVPTTDSHHGYQVYPNLLASLELTAPNQAWEILPTFAAQLFCLLGMSAGCLLTALCGLEVVQAYRYRARFRGSGHGLNDTPY
jgi:transposase InsO family protein